MKISEIPNINNPKIRMANLPPICSCGVKMELDYYNSESDFRYICANHEQNIISNHIITTNQ